MFSRRTFGKAAMHDNGRRTADRLSLEQPVLYLAACRPSSVVRLYAADRRSKGGLHLEGEGKQVPFPG